jgi:hypothetical protein
MKNFLLFLGFFIIYGAVNLPVFSQDSQQLSLPSDGRTVKLSPQIRLLERERRIPTIKMEAIQQFLNRPKLVTETEIENAGSIIGNAELSFFSTEGNEIYVKGLDEFAVEGSRYMIMRLGQTYRSPMEENKGEVLAYEAIFLGEAVLKKAGSPASLNITMAVREIRRGDLLVPLEEHLFFEDIRPHSAKNIEEAYIIAVLDDSSIISQYQIVVINKGLDDAIERGHVLAIKKNNRRLKEVLDSDDDVSLKQQVGILLVFRVFDNISYALVTKSSLPIHIFDEVTVL